MNINTYLPFDKAHRLGARRAGQTFPRAIIAKFERFKDREEVKRLPPKTLIGKPFAVREQFPKEIEDKRKILYGEMKKAKRNLENKVKLVRDKLFINNTEYIPEEARSYENQTHKSRGRSFEPLEGRPYRDQSERRPEVSRTDTRYKSRYIYQRPGSSTELAQFTRTNRMNPIETSNRFDGLSECEPSTPIRNNPVGQRTISRKQKAVSPLEANYTQKRQCEGSSIFEQNKLPQSDPPVNEEGVKTIKSSEKNI